VFDGLWDEASFVALQARFHVCEPSWALLERVLPHHQFWVVTAGRASFTLGLHRYRLAGGDVLIVPPHTRMRGDHDPADPLRCYVLHGTVRVLGTAIVEGQGPLPIVCRPAPEAWRLVVAEADLLCAEWSARRVGYRLLAGSALARIAALLWREGARRPPAAGGLAPADAPEGAPERAGDRRIAPALDYIAAHYQERVRLSDLARAAHLTPAYMSTTFRRVVGLPPLQYVHRYRMQRAKHLLESGDKSVAHVAAATGFRDAFYFSRAFKRSEGVSPLRYRLAQRRPLMP